MRTLLCAIPALLALAGTASAEPQQLDEAQLGGVAAGQDLGASPTSWSLSTSEITSLSTNSSSTSSVQETIGQTLSGGSTNTNYATGMNSTGVSAIGSAGTSVLGTIGSIGDGS